MGFHQFCFSQMKVETAEKIVFIATAWGSKNGGVNAFNADLAKAVSDLLVDSYKVISVVLHAGDDDIAAARESDVYIVKLKTDAVRESFDDSDLSEILNGVSDISGRVVWWIGHDVITGPIAVEASKRSGQGRSAIVHHMDYEAYESYKDVDASRSRTKIEHQREVLSGADLVFAVGPKLVESAKEKIAGNKQQQVVELIPGLASIEGRDAPTRFSAITFGRLIRQNARVKQTRLAVAAFARARSEHDHLGADSSLMVIGLSDSNTDAERRDLLTLSENIAGRAIQIHGWPFIEDRERLFDHLRRQSVCLMLSLHEGFGLVGWEAIAAEVPLIVSRNSGLYETLDRLLGGMATGCVKAVDILGSMGDETFQPEDVETIARAIVQVKERGTKAKQDARLLKSILNKTCTWRDTASTLVEACALQMIENLANIKISRWSPEVLIEALVHSTDVVEEAARRKNHFQRIWDKMKPPSAFQNRLVLFGGVATALCDELAASRYAEWLALNSEARLYVCYESGPAALARARKLDQEGLETGSGLPAEAAQRMKVKEQRVLALRDLIERNAGDERADLSKRVHVIALREPLTSYIMIADDDVYITPLFETRSSETLTFALAARPPQFRLDVLNFLIYHLQMLEHSEDATVLIEELRNDITKAAPHDEH